MRKEEKRKDKSFADISPQAQEREKSPVTLLKRKISKNPKVEKLLDIADSVTISPKLDAELEEKTRPGLGDHRNHRVVAQVVGTIDIGDPHRQLSAVAVLVFGKLQCQTGHAGIPGL